MKAKSDAKKTTDQKFVGIRLDPDRAEELKAMADSRGISLNQLVASMLSGIDDPNPTAAAQATVRQVRKSLDSQNVNGDDVSAKVQRLHSLISLRNSIWEKREALKDEEPYVGPISQLLGINRKELEEWRKKVDALQKKYEKILQKIAALEDEVIELETAEAAESESDAIDEQEGEVE